MEAFYNSCFHTVATSHMWASEPFICGYSDWFWFWFIFDLVNELITNIDLKIETNITTYDYNEFDMLINFYI